MATSRRRSCAQCSARNSSPRIRAGKSLCRLEPGEEDRPGGGRVRHTLTCSEPSGLTIRGPQSADIRVGIERGDQCVARSRPELGVGVQEEQQRRSVVREGPVVRAAEAEIDLILDQAQPRRDQISADSSERSHSRLPSVEALSTTTISKRDARREWKDAFDRTAQKSPPFQLTMTKASPGIVSPPAGAMEKFHSPWMEHSRASKPGMRLMAPANLDACWFVPSGFPQVSPDRSPRCSPRAEQAFPPMPGVGAGGGPRVD